jgi:protein-S-isoprenylcysteine O-methyltransferase Ste14
MADSSHDQPRTSRLTAAPGHHLPVTRRFEFPIELAARTLTVLSLSFFAYNALRIWYADPTRITLIFMLCTTVLTVGLALFSKVPAQRDWRPISLLFTFAGTYYYLFFQLTENRHLVPEDAAAAIQIAGLLLQLYAKWSLRQSFGLLPANRGIVSRGPYRIVRHPIYLAYLISDCGFLLANFSWRNIITIALLFGIQIGRIYREEKLLLGDPLYRDYSARVRYRVLPGIF